MTCAKRQVTCYIVTTTGETFVGRNTCREPQNVCPRDPGEGYEKCVSICKQIGHAEEVVLNMAREKAKGATAYLENHSWYCRNCQEKLFAAGVVALKLGSPTESS